MRSAIAVRREAADRHSEGRYGKRATASIMASSYEAISWWIGLKENCTKQNTIRECALLLMALAVWTEPALARSYLNCLAKKVMIVDAPRGSTSSSIEENLGFWIDEAAKTLVLADGTPLTVRRLDDSWISAARGDMSYEFDRQNGNLTYASSTTKEGSATIIIGSGRCKIAV